MNAVRAEEGLWLVGGTGKYNSQMTPLIGAIQGRYEDLTLWLLTLPGQELDLDRLIDRVQEHALVGTIVFPYNGTLLHLCAGKGCARAAKKLVRRGADMDVMDAQLHSPLCTAASTAQLPLVRYCLQQYQRKGESELLRALSNPCRKEGTVLAPGTRRKRLYRRFRAPRGRRPLLGAGMGGGCFETVQCTMGCHLGTTSFDACS